MLKLLNGLQEPFDFKIILKNLPMLDIVRYGGPVFHFCIIPDPGWLENFEIAY